MAEDVVRAKRFELVDENETPRGGLEIDESGAAHIHLRDAAGKSALRMTVREDGTAIITLRDEQERVRGSIAYRSAESTAAPGSLGIVLAGEGGEDRAQFGIAPEGDPNLMLFDQEGTEVLSLAVTDTGTPALTLNDSQGIPRAGIAVREDGAPVLTLLDEHGRNVWGGTGI